jgi:hypothetical protein
VKAVIFCGYRHTIESPRCHYPDAELWMQSTSIRNWDWSIYNWSRWFDIHTVGPQAHYPGIQIQRPDVFAWYTRQGNERPIYLVETHPEIMGSVAYPKATMEAAFGARAVRVSARLHGRARAVMKASTAGFSTAWGNPTSAIRTHRRRAKWLNAHYSFLWWMRLARQRGVEIVFDGPNMFTPELYGNEPPREQPMSGAYGYDMQSDFEHYTRVQREGFALTR